MPVWGDEVDHRGYARANRIFLVQALIAAPTPQCPTAIWEDIDKIAASSAAAAIAALRAHSVHPLADADATRLRALPYDGVFISDAQEPADPLTGLVGGQHPAGEQARHGEHHRRQHAPGDGARIIPFPRHFRPPPRDDAG